VRWKTYPNSPNAELPDDEYLGWGMTAVAAKLLGAMGAYRCPGENGFVYVVCSSIAFADDTSPLVPSPKEVERSDHGRGFATYACEHLVSSPAQAWHSSEPNEENKWPDAWCDTCEVFFQEQGEWNEKNESKMKILYPPGTKCLTAEHFSRKSVHFIVQTKSSSLGC